MVYPFRRAAARFIDYLLWGMLAVAVLGEKTGDVHSPSWLFYASFWGYIFVEAVLISVFATTIGKRLTGIYVYGPDGKKLPFLLSLKRAFLVFGAGMGFFLPYVSLVLPLYAFYRLVKYKTVFWDMVSDSKPESIKTTLADKLLLAAFILFLLFGYFLTARTAFIHREPDFSVIEDSVLTSYFNDIRPQMVRILSEESVLSPQAAVETAHSLKHIQKMLQYQKEELILIRDQLQQRIDKMPIEELRRIRQKQLDAVMMKMNNFLFAESMRVSLFENILEFFKSAEKNKYVFINGRPVFQDPEMRRQYDNFMAQLQAFLSLPLL
ncbi:MAG: RDD family protein [Alphaproteobacteria bacterium]